MRVVAVPPEFPVKWDLADPLPDGFTPDDLRAFIEAAEPLAPEPAGEEPANDELGQEELADLIERAKADVGAAFEDTALRQLADLKSRDRAAFVCLRTELKTVA